MPTQMMEITNEAEWLEKRKGYVTSTEVPALFGLQPAYMPTAFEMWHIKKGLLPSSFEQNNHMLLGKLIEEPIAQIAAIENPNWDIQQFPFFAYDDEDKIGSSFDRVIYIDGKKWLGEIKSISYAQYKEHFTENEDGSMEAKDAYEFQMQTELELVKDQGFEGIILIVLILDTRTMKYIYRKHDVEMGLGMRAAVKEFMNLDTAPQPDYSVDKGTISKLAPKADDKKEMDAKDNERLSMLCGLYKSEKSMEKQASENASTYYAEILHMMGDHKRAFTLTHKVTASDIKESFKIVTEEMVGTKINERGAHKRLTITEV